ncbi:hypothetical protein Tco_0981481 [Tanacetum coccineum]
MSKLTTIIASVIGVILAIWGAAGVTFIIEVSKNNYVLFPKSVVHKKSVKHKTMEQLAAELAKSASIKAEGASVKDKAAREKPEARSVKAKEAREEPAKG